MKHIPALKILHENVSLAFKISSAGRILKYLATLCKSYNVDPPFHFPVWYDIVKVNIAPDIGQVNWLLFLFTVN